MVRIIGASGRLKTPFPQKAGQGATPALSRGGDTGCGGSMTDSKTSFSDAISSVEEIIEDARNGRMFILVDH